MPHWLFPGMPRTPSGPGGARANWHNPSMPPARKVLGLPDADLAAMGDARYRDWRWPGGVSPDEGIRRKAGPLHWESNPYSTGLGAQRATLVGGYVPPESTKFGPLPKGAAGQIEELIDQLERGRAVDIRQPTAVNLRAAERMAAGGPPKWKAPTRPHGNFTVSDDFWERLKKKKKKHHGQEVRAWKKMTADWEKLLTSADRAEIATGLERNLRSIKPQQLQMLMPAEELKAVTPNDWLAMVGTGNPTSLPARPPAPPGWSSGAPSGPTGSGPGAVVPAWSGGSSAPKSIEDVWKIKLEESKLPESTGRHGSGIYESVKAKGVKPTPMEYGSYIDTPIMLAHQEAGLPSRIAEGHHRVAAAADINPRMEVPFANVEYNPGGSWGPGHGLNAVQTGTAPAGELPFRRIKQIVPNEDIVKQLMKFTRNWGMNALRLMMKVPK